jgi:acid phosphatase (class A)|tara:strand:+ start:302 stop:943 length:642 start_codon:yes stop_codon:yes gene_type:complete
MINLKNIIVESLKDMVFSKTIKPRHKKLMSKKTTMFNDNLKLTMTPPPTNDSQKTKAELHYLLAYNEGVIDNKFVEEYDDIIEPFMLELKKSDVSVSENDLQEIIDESVKFIMKVKYKYNRPRPYQIAEHYNIEDFKIHKLDTAQTPSYPSGHALQGRLIALMLSEKDPYNENQYMEISKNISESRIMARVHFPSDKEYGEKLADELFEQRIK